MSSPGFSIQKLKYWPVVVVVRNQNQHQHGQTEKQDNEPTRPSPPLESPQHIPHVRSSIVYFRLITSIFDSKYLSKLHTTIPNQAIITMSTPTHHPPSIIVPVNGDNLDVLMEDIRIGFQTSPTDSPASPASRMIFFYPC